MSDNTEKPVESERLPGVMITPPEVRDRSLSSAGFPRSEEIGRQVRSLAGLGLSKNAISRFLRISQDKFERDYGEDVVAGKYDMSVRLATLAMEAAEAGDSKMIQYLCKVKLGWTETSTVEHIGEVRAVVSAKPLTKEEFEKRYLQGAIKAEFSEVEE
jgi:hypothetical protein